MNVRLIDADNLKIHLLYDDSWDLEYPTYGVFDYEIQEELTVDAIPIEWIKKQVADGYYDIAEIMYHWELENNIKENILFGGENDF